MDAVQVKLGWSRDARCDYYICPHARDRHRPAGARRPASRAPFEGSFVSFQALAWISLFQVRML